MMTNFGYDIFSDVLLVGYLWTRLKAAFDGAGDDVYGLQLCIEHWRRRWGRG